MADGTTKPISQVQVGDKVLASDPESGRTASQKVTDVIVGEGQKRLVDIETDGKVLTATDRHPFYSATRHGWVAAGDLAPGEQLRTADGKTVLVDTIRVYTVSDARVFNLTVENIHTFFAGETKALVHNCAWSWYDGRRSYLVYLGLSDGSPLYVGKASTLTFRDRRWAHLRDRALIDDVQPFIKDLTEREALVLETRIYERFRDFLTYNDRRSLKLSPEQSQWADDFLRRVFGI
jgi:pretoxin HINT domain-containing protein